MLPPFDEYGNLPAGIHACAMDELAERFGHGSPERIVEIAELIEFLHWARRAGVERVIVNGSFVTARPDSNDVDVIVLPGHDYPRGSSPATDEEYVWPFLQIIVAADEADLLAWSHSMVSRRLRDRSTWPKQGCCRGVAVTELLNFNEYEQTRIKLARLEQRLAELEHRTDLPADRMAESRQSYHRMMQQYLRELKLYEASHPLHTSST